MPRIAPIPWDKLKPEQRSAIQTGMDSGAYRIALPLQILAYGDHDQVPDGRSGLAITMPFLRKCRGGNWPRGHHSHQYRCSYFLHFFDLLKVPRKRAAGLL